MSNKTHRFYHVKLVREGRPVYSPVIICPSEAVAFFQKQIGQNVQESFTAIFLNIRNVPLGWREISRGSVDASLVHPRDVFLPAVQLAASCLIMAHNHPSGDPAPSRNDIELTQRLKSAGDLLGIEVLDHLIVTSTGHLSMKQKGLL
jgi:DNA repair protein RadC